MIGKTVKLKDNSILNVLYPDYIEKSYVSFLDRDTNVIYTGKPFNRHIEYLEKNTKSFISVVGNPDIDLSENLVLAEYLYELKGKKMSSKISTFLESIDDKEFLYCMKLFYFTGKLPYEVGKNSSLFDLYVAITGPLHNLIKVFYSVYEVYPHEVIESALFTFLVRVSTNATDGISNRYAYLIKNTKAKIGNKLKPAVHKYAQTNQTQLDLLSMLLELIS